MHNLQDCNITCGEEALDETSESVKTFVNLAVVAKYEWVIFFAKYFFILSLLIVIAFQRIYVFIKL